MFNDLLEIEIDALLVPIMETPFGQAIDNICQSVVASLEFLVLNKEVELAEDSEDLSIFMLETLETVIDYSCLFHENALNDILFRIIFPLINSELQYLQEHCESEDDLKIALSELSDCCQNQQNSTILSRSCRILELIVDNNTQLRLPLRMNSFLALIEHLQLAKELSYQP